MIIKARHHFFYYPFFKFYAGWSIHRHFGHVEINGEFKDRNLPVLLLANHFSWWDGIMALYLNVSLLKRKFHFMVMEEQLTKFQIAKRDNYYPAYPPEVAILTPNEWAVRNEVNNAMVLEATA